MYYLVFGLAYGLSLLPFWCLYRLSDFTFFILYHVTGYRKTLVLENLRHAFPEKTMQELEAIRRSYYHKFCDNWVEMLKIMSITKRQADKRITYDYSVLEKLYKTGKPVQGFSGHFMNWE